MPSLKSLHEYRFQGRSLNTIKIYEDPFSDNELCIELMFEDGTIELVCIGAGKPEITSCSMVVNTGFESLIAIEP